MTEIAPKKRGRPAKLADPTTPGGRLQVLRMREAMSQDDMASVLGVTRSMISKYEDGSHDMGPEILQRAGRRFNVTPSWILFDEPVQFVSRTAQVMGTVGAGGEIDAVPDESLGRITIPSHIEDATLYRVKGDSCQPVLEEGDLIGVSGPRRLNLAEVRNKLCVVETEGLSFVKVVVPNADIVGGGRRFDLVSPNNDYEPMTGRLLESARPVIFRLMPGSF